MAPTPSDLFERLSRDGHRLTGSRRAVIHALHAAGGAVTVRDLHAAVGRDADLVTVYRTLAWLASLGVARQVATGGGAERFELAGMNGEHTHHLHCRTCGSVLTVPASGLDSGVYDQLRRDHGFSVHDHTLTFHGTCANCSAA
ncbi:MAG TPA: Fur family transcriptional regulator [Longimicrobium sp.]|nr:Fur family transcriptional regulator [Longimicrobium sp.]